MCLAKLDKPLNGPVSPTLCLKPLHAPSVAPPHFGFPSLSVTWGALSRHIACDSRARGCEGAVQE